VPVPVVNNPWLFLANYSTVPVVVLVGVLEEAVHGVEHLVGHGEEPFPRHPAIVQTLLTLVKELPVRYFDQSNIENRV